VTLPRLLTSLAWLAILVYLWRRRLFLPRDAREDFSLRVYPDGSASSGALRLDALRAALVRRGYEPGFFLGDEGEQAAPLDTLLSGIVVRVRDPRLRRGGVTLRVPQLPVQDAAWASVEVADTERGAYEELALYLIYELGKLIPPVEYKRSFSSLCLESTDTIEPLLPDHPHGLPR
jgi:hypothetical protein